MNYTEILNALNTATLFDLHRLKSIIQLELKNPDRIKIVAAHVKPKQNITYFDPDTNDLIEAVVIKTMKTRCLVRNKLDQKRWNIPFYYINLEDVDTNIYQKKSQQGLSKQTLKIGDTVGFKNKQHEDTYGQIIRLNPKTVTIIVSPDDTWRVYYQHLFSVLDADTSNTDYLPNIP